MERLVSATFIAVVFALWPELDRIGFVEGAVVLVVAGVVAAAWTGRQSSADSALSEAALLCGAFGALALELVPGVALPGAFAVACFHGPRVLRARSFLAAAVLVAMAMATGAAAMSLSIAYSQASWPLFLTAVGLGVLVLHVPFAVAVDDGRTAALMTAWRRESSVSLRRTLLRAVALRRKSQREAPHAGAAERWTEEAWRRVSSLLGAAAQAPGSEAEGLRLRAHAHLRAVARVSRAARSETLRRAGLAVHGSRLEAATRELRELLEPAAETPNADDAMAAEAESPTA
jgi:hypothetical protein